MTVDASEPRLPLEWPFLFFIREVVVLLVQVLLAITKIYNEYFILFLTQTYYKVSGINVVVDETFGMNPLNAIQNLISYQQHCLEGEGSIAVLQQLVKRRPKDISHQSTIIMFNAVPI